MDFQTSIKTCFKKYADFSGRASRSEFWWFELFLWIAMIVAAIIDTMMLGYAFEDYGPVYIIYTVVTLLPAVAVGARRLHDINRSGWWQLLYITLIGIILLIIWWATVGENKKKQSVKFCSFVGLSTLLQGSVKKNKSKFSTDTRKHHFTHSTHQMKLFF